MGLGHECDLVVGGESGVWVGEVTAVLMLCVHLPVV